MASPEVKRIKRKIKKDDRFKALKENLDSERFNIPFDTWRKELKFNHSQRTLTKLKTSDPKFGKKVIKSTQREMSTRSRCVEMKVMCTQIERSMKSALDYFEDYLLLEYSVELKHFGTVKERQKFVQGLLRPFQEYLDKVISMNAEIQVYIDDIDKAGYGLKAMVDVFVTIFKTEGRVVGKNI